MSIKVNHMGLGIANGRLHYVPGRFDSHVLLNTSAGAMDPFTITNVTINTHINYPHRLEVTGFIKARYDEDPKPLSDAMRLAIAVLCGDERAALLLVDEVQLNYLRR